MELCRLKLTAFGPFTDHLLDFEQGGAKLHIVYGANEAGKSSALRGLRALLYGIEPRSADNFLHDYRDMRVAGRLRSEGGEELDFIRRKGIKKTLLDVDGEPLDPLALQPYLQGVSAEIFDSLFGIDHHALVRGGEEILDQQGEVGQALFSAALGSQALHQLLAELDAEADALFRPQGSTRTINRALKSYDDKQREVREQSLSSSVWREKSDEIESVNKRLESISKEISNYRSEQNRLQRIRRVQPKIARREQLRQQLAALGDVVVLGDDFAKRRRQALQQLETALQLKRRAERDCDALQQQLEGIAVNDLLLQLGEAIEAQHERVGAYRKAMLDRPGLQSRYAQLREDAARLLSEIRPALDLDDAELLRPVYARRERIARLISSQQQLAAALKSADRELRETEASLQEAADQLQQLKQSASADNLRAALDAARREGDLEQALEGGRMEQQRLEQQAAAGLARLGLWQGGIDGIALLPLPADESISRFEQSFEQLLRQQQRLEERRAGLAQRRHETERQLDEARGAGEVPTEEQLERARQERDSLWRRLRRHWLVGEEPAPGAGELESGEPLAERFEQRIDAADEISDRLRREAGRVQQQAALDAQLRDVQLRTAELGQELQQWDKGQQLSDAEWRQLWQPCAIEPLPPREMREWLGALEKLRQMVEITNEIENKNKEIENKINVNSSNIHAELALLGRGLDEKISLGKLQHRAGEVVTAMEQLAERRQLLLKEQTRLGQKLHTLQNSRREAQLELDAWRTSWLEAIEGLGLSSQAEPAEATALIDRSGELFGKLAEARDLQQRIDGIDRDAGMFREEVQRIVGQVGEDLAGLAEEDAATRLSALLAANRERKSRRTTLSMQSDKLSGEMRESTETIASMEQRLEGLCDEAGCSGPTELDDAERRSAQALELRGELESLEEQILDAGEGIGLAALEQEAAEVDTDSLPAGIMALERTIGDELQPLQNELTERKGRLRKELELMDGSGRVASLAEESQLLLADIRSHAERYVRVKLAARILRDQIEEYRSHNQGPLISRASEHFSVLTGGSFASLQTDFNTRDEPVLVGIRADDARVHVEGMSSGSRDQLYLALRLASLEKYLDNAAPMPFIVDDILVDFDDQRSSAALQRLAELSRKTQVILFSHHSRVVEQAKELGQEAVQVHEL